MMGTPQLMATRKLLTLVVFSTLAAPAAAESPVPAAVTTSLGKLVPGLSPSSVRATPVKGLYEVAYGPELFYISADGRYVLRGDLLDPGARRNLTEERRSEARVEVIEGLGEDSMVVFAPKNTKHTVSVFTDIDCPYCRKFHQEIPELNKGGVKVRYLAYPRAGEGSKAYEKAVSVWCSADRNTAMTDAKAGKEMPKKSCENPVDKHAQAGRRVGVTGTPSIVLEDGQIVPGYVPAKRLVQALEAGQQ